MFSKFDFDPLPNFSSTFLKLPMDSRSHIHNQHQRSSSLLLRQQYQMDIPLPQPVAKTMSKAMNDIVLWHILMQPLIQASTGCFSFAACLSAVTWEGKANA